MHINQNKWPSCRFNIVSIALVSTIAALLIQSPGQVPPPSIKRAIDSLFNPQTGDEALKQSCRKISILLKNYINAHKRDDVDAYSISDGLNTANKLTEKIDQLDRGETIDAFIKHSVVFLIRHPSDPSYPERLWKLAAIVDLKEQSGKHVLLKTPFFPALLNACSQLPPDNTFNLEGQFLAAKHHGHRRELGKQEEILKGILKRPKLSPEGRFTGIRELAAIIEKQERFEEALKLYSTTKKDLNIFPQAIDFSLHSALIHLELGNQLKAQNLLLELKNTPTELRSLTSTPKPLETLIQLASKAELLTKYWNHSNKWWAKWEELRTLFGVNRPTGERRAPKLIKSENIQKSFADAVASGNDALFYDQLDLLMHTLRWSPSPINDAGAALCFFSTQIQNKNQEKIYDLVLSICNDFPLKDTEFERTVNLYQIISYSATNDPKTAIKIIEEFLAKDSSNDEITRSIIRLWAHLAVNGHTPVEGPRDALEKILSSNNNQQNRSQSVLYLAQIYRKSEHFDKEKSLLKSELQQPSIRSNEQIYKLLSARFQELTEGVSSNAEFTQAVTDWVAKHSPHWLRHALTEGLKDSRLENTELTKALADPSAAGFSPEEALKLRLLVSGSDKYNRSLREQAFQSAFSEFYSGASKHSTARKMLRGILSDDRFSKQLRQILLIYSLDEALARVRKRDITNVITHPLLDRKNPRLQAAVQAYGRFASTDLSSEESLKECYNDLTKEKLGASEFAVIAQIFERLIQIGAVESAETLSIAASKWQFPQQLKQRHNALVVAFEKSIERAHKTVSFGEKMHKSARKLSASWESEPLINLSDYRRAVDLKRLSEKDAFDFLLHRATGNLAIENSPRFWFNFAELMPRGNQQVHFAFELVETLLASNIPDLEKSFSIFSAPSIIDTDDAELRGRLFDVFKKYRNHDTQPYTYAATRITEIQSRDLRLGNKVDIDKEWGSLNHPALKNILTPTKLGQLIARQEKAELREMLKAMPSRELLSENLLDVAWPAFLMAEMDAEVKLAEVAAKGYIRWAIPRAARYLDFQSIRFVYDSAKRFNNPSIIPEDWFDYLDTQILAERDRYSLRIIDAEFRKDWKALAKWSGKAVKEYPTYYNYYRPRGLALEKLGKIEEAIAALQTYVKYSKDEAKWNDASMLLESLLKKSNP